ncbi:carbohydrate-binding module family 18 protein [Zopfia rhizophila CBS 207.26]|uniref:chitinase n=1 Tax=Zopfia rhizophila CBS 207.26 TaxID=1314779 RepID=A0A6A6DNW0_9PEZI|nr:carbohydrate-binding module family 18 protein [Zopfia rhizophila CBS 207.26]
MIFRQLLALLAPLFLARSADARFLIYYDQWHNDRPGSPEDRVGIDHVILAFAQSNNTSAFQPIIPISTVRQEYPQAKVMIAVGGWGDNEGFSQAVRSATSRATFAQAVASLIQTHRADGVDIDWEYPGGNGADYKQNPNSGRTGEIEQYPLLLAAIRTTIGKDKILSIAVPGLKRDMIAFTPKTGPQIWPSVDYINVMSYDLMNRRDNVTKHHTPIIGSGEAIQNYLDIGAPSQKINLGFAYYAKWFTTATDCGNQPFDCAVAVLENPNDGSDTGRSGAWTFEKVHMEPVPKASEIAVSMDGTCGAQKKTKCATGCCGQYGYCGTGEEHCGGGCQHAFGTGCMGADVAGSWQRALTNGVLDPEQGGQYFYDGKERLFWTWETPKLIARKFAEIVEAKGLGGVMAWSLGEDSYDWSHIMAMATNQCD